MYLKYSLHYNNIFIRDLSQRVEKKNCIIQYTFCITALVGLQNIGPNNENLKLKFVNRIKNNGSIINCYPILKGF